VRVFYLKAFSFGAFLGAFSFGAFSFAAFAFAAFSKVAYLINSSSDLGFYYLMLIFKCVLLLICKI